VFLFAKDRVKVVKKL